MLIFEIRGGGWVFLDFIKALQMWHHSIALDELRNFYIELNRFDLLQKLFIMTECQKFVGITVIQSPYLRISLFHMFNLFFLILQLFLHEMYEKDLNLRKTVKNFLWTENFGYFFSTGGTKASQKSQKKFFF